MTTSTKSEDVEALAPLIMKALNWCDEMAGEGFEVPELVMFDMWQALGEPDGESCGPVIADTLRALIAERDALREALDRQCDNMAFVLNRAILPQQWLEKFDTELTEDRAALGTNQ